MYSSSQAIAYRDKLLMNPWTLKTFPSYHCHVSLFLSLRNPSLSLLISWFPSLPSFPSALPLRPLLPCLVPGLATIKVIAGASRPVLAEETLGSKSYKTPRNFFFYCCVYRGRIIARTFFFLFLFFFFFWLEIIDLVSNPRFFVTVCFHCHR